MDENNSKVKTNEEILAEWEAEKKAKKELDRARFQARPLWQRILIRTGEVLAVLAVLLIIGYFAGGKELLISAVTEYYTGNAYAIETMDLDEIRKDVVIDEDSVARVEAMPRYSKDDTWAVYVYMVGSNLESFDENDLSEIMKYISEAESQKNKTEYRNALTEGIEQYLTALDEAGMEMPSPMYTVVKPEAASVPVTDDVVVADGNGCAWDDIQEMLKAELSDNVDVVIQTGGSKRWTKAIINPNRVQRFHLEDHSLIEEDSMQAFNMGCGDAIADFLSYCEKNHQADHKIVIFWNHGGASFGYGLDEIFGRLAPLSELKEAFAKVYGNSPSKPPFELIGFDACMMSGAEVINALNGYGRFLAASEENEPGDGWYYTKWLTALSNDASMNGAQIGRLIADGYMDFYKAQDIAIPLRNNNVCFSVTDISEGKKAYDEYISLVCRVLNDTCSNPEALTALCRGAHESIHYGGASYDSDNTVDLGVLAENVKERYPDECRSITDRISNAVLYNRTENNMVGSKGINVFFPDIVVRTSSLGKLMKYVNTISDSKELSALYFYKSAGCLSEEMRKTLKEIGISGLENIDVKALKEVQKSDVIITEEGNFSLTVSERARKYLQDYKYDIALYDAENDWIIDYGHNTLAYIDDTGSLSTDFTGKWICLDGQPLSTEIMQSHAGIITYRSPILLDNEDAQLIFSFDSSKNEFAILGAYLKEDEIHGDFAARNRSDLTLKSRITPVYEYTDESGYHSLIYGDPVSYGKNTTIGFDRLEDGTYYSAITFTDVRGDEFNSSVVSFDIAGSKMINTMVSTSVVLLED